MNTEKQVTAYICEFDGVITVNYFEGDPVRTKVEVEVKVKRLRNSKAADKV